MKLPPRDPPWRWLALLAAIGAAGQAWGQQDRYNRIEEPRWLRLDIRETRGGVYAEGNFENTSYSNSGASYERQYIFVGPTLGLDADGSAYHPNLMQFSFHGDGAVGWGTETLDSPTSTRDRSELQYLGRFKATADILRKRPYRVNLFGDYDHRYQDYDFFNRVIADTWRYGARAGYREGPVPVGILYFHRVENIGGFEQGDTSSVQDTVSVDARNDRETGSSYASYSYNEVERQDFGRSSSGSDHVVTFSNNQNFGSRNQHQGVLTGSYRHSDFTAEESDRFIASANFAAEHRPNLESYYDFTFEHFETDTFASDSYSGWSELRHQLYESLASSLRLQGSHFKVDDFESDGFITRLGAGFSEGYTKQVGESGRLRLDNSFLIENVDQESVGTIRDERHSFAAGGGGAPPDSFFLNQPSVIPSTIVITDVNNTLPPYLQGLDYTVDLIGNRTLISRPIGSRIPVNAIVLVDYEVEPTPPGSYQSLNNYFQVRYEFWNNLWGLYGRINLNRNNADPELQVPELTFYTVGSDVHWRWLRAGVEYQIYDSTASSYNALHLFQSFMFRPDQISSFVLDFSETFTDFKDINESQQDYRFTTNYRRTLTGNLTLQFDGGLALRRGRNLDQTLGAARPGLEYAFGKTTVKAEYNFEYEKNFGNEERFRHLFFLRATRVF